MYVMFNYVFIMKNVLSTLLALELATCLKRGSRSVFNTEIWPRVRLSTWLASSRLSSLQHETSFICQHQQTPEASFAVLPDEVFGTLQAVVAPLIVLVVGRAKVRAGQLQVGHIVHVAGLVYYYRIL